MVSLEGLEAAQNPYPLYEELRASGRAAVSAGNIWLVSRHADVSKLLRDRRLSAARPLPDRSGLTQQERDALQDVDQCFRLWLTFREPPDHTPLRGVCTSGLTTSFVQQTTPIIQRWIAELLQEAIPGQVFDVLQGLAYQLPILIVGEMLGIQASTIRSLMEPLDEIVDAFGTGNVTLKTAGSYAHAVSCIRQVLSSTPQDSLPHLLKHLTHARDAGVISEAELLSNIVFLLIAGRETTTNLIANSLHCLLRFPDQWKILQDDPSKIDGAVEEALRFEAPIQYVGRRAIEVIPVGDSLIQPGDQVLLLIGSANRDPDVFPDADSFQVRRHPNPHLAFIVGVHHCLGASLARLETRLTLHSIVKRFDRMELAEEISWRGLPAVRGMDHLFVRFYSKDLSHQEIANAL